MTNNLGDYMLFELRSTYKQPYGLATNRSAGKVDLKKNLGDTVTNEHLGKCVRMCLTHIQVTKSQKTWKHDLVSMVF